MLLGRAIQGEAGVVLLGDVGRELDPHRLYDVALDVQADDVSGVFTGLIGVGGKLHATGLAPSTDVDLGLDDHRVADPFGGGHGVFDGGHRLTRADRDVEAREELLALVLEKVHEDSWEVALNTQAGGLGVAVGTAATRRGHDTAGILGRCL